MPSLEERVEHLEVLAVQTNELIAVCAQEAQASRVAHQQNTRLINALAQTQREHTETLADHTRRLDGIDSRLDGIDSKLADHDRRFDAIDLRFDAIDRRFEDVDRRFEGIDGRLDAMASDISGLKSTVGKVAVGMYTLERLIRRIVPDDGEDPAAN